MSTASIGRPSCVRNSAFSVPSLALASRSKVSAESGTAAWSSARRSAGRFVISSYDDAPLATHCQIWRPRKPGSPRAASVLSSSSKSTGRLWQRGRGEFRNGGRTSLEAVRLAKYLAHAGVASRRASEDLIRDGKVTVDGTRVTNPATDVSGTERIELDGTAVSKAERVVYMLNKPKGVVSTASDTHGRPTVVSLIGSSKRLYPVGRLDADTTGLILLTNDGELANRLTHPRYEVAKTYRAKVEGRPTEADLQ